MEEELECTCNGDCNCHKPSILGMCVATLGLGIVVIGHVMMCKKCLK